MAKEIQILSKSEKDTIHIARTIAPLFHAGDLIVLSGDLGAGKTHFVKGFTEGYHSKDLVTSPTFSIANFYRTNQFDILHIDLYRITTIEEFLDLGLTDYFDQSVVLVEWGTKFADCFEDYMLISLASKKYNERLITFAGNGGKYESIIEHINEKSLQDRSRLLVNSFTKK
ncbi:MAG: tRNA (adenosine(37)-N6)-threonylcarbamoyltransferase complex ATPase subunit type 1 TsaE [Dysgonamonadaceae bacterium]|jgi:tRNA threonylcarbamoyladenosine biosynthesis protein TsaE|nr:tRNA (adenosine(37)-N6)-threonylcarbamoyltransferase complex ATPase subunit type 1 TsaE [Dysgonamonadaceae bacterium]